MNDLWRFGVPCNPDSLVTSQHPMVCSGSSLNITAHNHFPASISWFTTQNPVIPVASGSLITTPALSAAGGLATYTYYAQSNSCTISPLAMVTITVLPLPQISVTGPGSVCPMQQATLTANGAQTYTWNNAIISNSLVLNISSATDYTISGTSTNNCQNTIIYPVGMLNLPDIAASSERMPVCRNEAVTLNATGGASYVWNGTTSGASIVVTPSISTTYTVHGTDSNGCSNSFTITQFVSICAGINEEANSVKRDVLYPNPGNGLFNVVLEYSAMLLLTDQLGVVRLEQKLEPGINSVKTGLCKGIYLYLITSVQSEPVKGKLIVE